MDLKKKIEILREELNNIVVHENNLSKDDILKISRKLDKLIAKYFK